MFTSRTRLHADEEGTISIVTVFAVLLLTMLLGMVMNAGREVDGKIRMQNAADAAAYCGGVVCARGMNTLAFSNHLLCDVFALTAFMREARDRNSQKYVPSILAAWNRVAPRFSAAPLAKLQALASAIPQKTPLEQEVVQAFGDWGAAASERILPVLEEILRQEMIPEFQRAVVQAYPDLAQIAAMEIAARHGEPDRGRGKLFGVLWRTSAVPVGGENERADPSLPVVDPARDTSADRDQYLDTARSQRRDLATQYLRDWNNEALAFFDREVKMCQFANLWRSFTCGYLERLLEEEYPERNLLHVIRATPDKMLDQNAHLEQHYTFVAVTYWRDLPKLMPRVFHNPTESDAEAFAEVRVFVPRARLVWCSTSIGQAPVPLGGMPGDVLASSAPQGAAGDAGARWYVGRQPVPTHWDLLNQHWTCQLVPATAANLPKILQTRPSVPGFDQHLRLPKFGEMTGEELGRISTH